MILDRLRTTTALLGPTNTGKTYYMVERMLTHANGMIGFPLRLLARENYDRVVEKVGKHAVALLTGEEKILPPHARYFLCTTESMPVDKGFEFIGVDEIQLCSDPERGHIFTDRLLNCRGQTETIFCGADTMHNVIRSLIPAADIQGRARLSELTWTGARKVSRLPRRSASVAFSVDDVYRLAEQIRRQRGGTAIVLGALSPRARNAQVGLYQSGEVDFLVATDAIGMGLNMDIHHVALAATRKFDGARPRRLNAIDVAQIAGRAGRHLRNGTFGVTGPVTNLEPDIVEAVQAHHFPPIEHICWRNTDLDFSSPLLLLRSLEAGSRNPLLIRGRPADDYLTLQALCETGKIISCATSPKTVQLLWESCQIPDFRKTLSDSHQALVSQIFTYLLEGPIPEDWAAKQISYLDNQEGDIDRLLTRMAYIRTWTFISHRPGWIKNDRYWQEKTLEIEDRLSDTLHTALTSRFVDRRSSVLIRSLQEGSHLMAGIRPDGEVTVEGHRVGQLDGFRFIPDNQMEESDRRAILGAARQALKPEITKRIQKMQNAQDKQFKLNDLGQIFFQPDPTNPLPGSAVAEIRKGTSLYSPDIVLLSSDLLQGAEADSAKERLKNWLNVHISTVLAPLVKLEQAENLPASARGIAFQLYERLGFILRQDLEDLISGLDEEGRRELRALGVRLGPVMVYVPAIGKPAAVRLRALLWQMWNDHSLPAPIPPDGMVSRRMESESLYNPAFQQAIGYPVYGPRMIRVDMLDRLICAVYDSAEKGLFRAQHKMAEWLGCPIDELYAVLEALGHRRVEEAPPPPPDTDSLRTTEIPAENAVAETEQTDTPEDADKPMSLDVTSAPQKTDEKPQLALFKLKSSRPAQKPVFKRPEKHKPDTRTDKKDIKPAPRHASRKKDKQNDRKQNNSKTLRAGPQKKLEDSPFAILQQLKTPKD